MYVCFQMGFSRSLFLVLFSWVLFASRTLQLRSYENQILLQLRKHLEYPMLLDNWENYNGDLCTLPTTPQISIKCENGSIIELRIMGNKPNNKVSVFNGYSIHNQTLSESFNTDSFVTTLARLSNLKVLTLVSLGIYGPLPDKIHRLYSLESIDMSSNFLFGVIPSGMSRMVKLQTFAFDDNFFNDTMPDWLDSLNNLTTLSLKNNRLKGRIPLTLSRMRTLNEIVLSHNLLTGKLPDLSGLSGLQLLDLRENKLDSELPSLPKGLANLFLSNNSFSGNIPEEFGKLDQIQHLDLSNNYLTGTPPVMLFSFPNISYLNLSFNMLGGSLPEHLNCGDALSLVDLSNNRLIGQLPSCLGTVNDDRTVSIRGNCFSIVARGQNSVAHCKHIDNGKTREKEIVVLAAVIGGIVIVVIIILAVGLCMFCKRDHTKQNVVQHIAPKVKHADLPSGISSDVFASARIISQAAKRGAQNSPSYRIFTIDELEEATMYFDESNLLGEGSLGKVYKGRLANGSFVAIRSLALSRKHLIRNLKMRLEMLSKLSHPHLVALLGHCTDGGNMQDELSVNRLFLVYEFVPNGNFRSHLSETAAGKVLKWSDRLGVLIGVAKAVHFLHTGVIPHSYSNKLKTHNILLDNHRIAKLSDYGMYILADESEKTEGKGDGSKSWHTSKLEDDVYKFGFILLESLVGPITSGKGETYLLNEMASFGSQDGRRKLVDPIVLTTSSQESLSIVISITNKCISTESSSRPSFEDVLWNLQYAAQVQATADADQKSDSTSLSGHQSR